jgi:uncharacterized damage-inducible protein DinB
MTDKEFFVSTVADEAPRFERVLKALPQDKLDWKPEPKARTAMELAATIAGESLSFSDFLKNGVSDIASEMASLKTVDEFVAAAHKGLADAQTIAAAMTDADWMSESKLVAGDKELWKTTKGKMALGLLLDIIHHRGQLSVYIRPMGGKVPAIYGPSADSNE